MANVWKKIDFTKIAEIRQAYGESQAVFWSRFGATQSAGSRYENGRDIPQPTKVLIALWLKNMINDEMLKIARKAIKH